MCQLVEQSCYGKYPQNGDRPLSCFWAQRPQNKVFIGMIATDDSCLCDGEESITDSSTENSQKAVFLKQVFSTAAYF